MSQPQQPSFPLDRTGVALIIALVLLIGPATIFASVWLLTHGFRFEASTPFELIAAALVAALALLMLRVGVGELRGGLGVELDDEGIRRGATRIRWAEVERVEVPSYGALEIVGAGQTLRLRTYLFREPKRLIGFIAQKSGVRIEAG